VKEVACDDSGIELTTRVGQSTTPEHLEMGRAATMLEDFSESPRSLSSHARQYVDIFPVPDGEIIKKGDILFVASGSGVFMNRINVHAMKGLQILDANVFDLAGFGSDLVEVVISNRNPFIGQSITSSSFSKYYGGPVIAARHVGSGASFGHPADGNDTNDANESVRHTNSNKTLLASQEMGVLNAGDLVMMVVNEATKKRLKTDFSADFFVVSSVGNLPAKVEPWDYGGVVLFAVMLVCLIAVDSPRFDGVLIMMITMMVMIFGGWVKPRDAFDSIDFNLLALIGSALSFAKSVDTSGLAKYIGDFVQNAGLPPLGALFLVGGMCMLMTNVVTNNAAAALSIPIALSVADSMDVDYRPFAMVVLYSASIAFMTPIGYQTNTMVWGPGGYTFGHFMKIGIPLNLLYVTFACLLVPLVFPF
jgi:hypothetical protein